PPGRESRIVEQPPEVVPRVGEVRLSRGRDATRVDAAEDRLQAGREDVRYSAGAAHYGRRGRSASGGAGRAEASARSGAVFGVGCTSSALCCLLLPAAALLLEEPADLLARQRGDQARRRLDDLDVARAAVAAFVALRLGHRLPRPPHGPKPRSPPGRHRETVR